MKWCIIGAGGIADRRTIPAILEGLENELVAVMDRVPATAERIGAKYGVPYYTDEEKMLKNSDCDAVYIGTPVVCHVPQAKLALAYGKHVFIEKPISLSAKEGEELVEAFKKAGKQITVGYMMKHHNLHEKAKEMIRADRIGQVTNVRVQFSCWYPDIDGAWRQKKALGGGGAIMDLGVHCIELVEFLLDEEITEVKGMIGTRTFSYEVEDSGIIVFKTASGILGHIDVNFNIPDDASESKLELYGTKGYVICKGTLGQVEGGSMDYLYAPQGDYSAAQDRTTAQAEHFLAAGDNIYLKQLRAFASAVESGTPDYFYADRAVQVQKLVDRIYAEQN